MNIFQRGCALLVAIASTSWWSACAYKVKYEPSPPTDIYSANHKYVVHMVPEAGIMVLFKGKASGTGTVFELADTGKRRLWSVPFYSNNVFLTGDGERLVVIGASRIGDERKEESSQRAYGYVDTAGNELIRPDFSLARSFSEGLARVEGGHTYIDKTGKTVFKLRSGYALDFHDGLAAADLGDKWGFIDNSGQVAIKPRFDEVDDFHEGFARVKLSSVYGFIDKSGKIVIKPQFKYASEFSDGLALVAIGDEYGFIDKSGTVVIKPQAGLGWTFSDGLARMEVAGRAGFVDKTGKMVIQPRFSVDGDFHDGLARVKIDGKKGFIDKTGRLVITSLFKDVSDFSEELAMTTSADNGSHGYMDKAGRTIVNPQFTNAGDFHEGVARVQVASKKWGFIDKTGKIVIKPQYDEVEDFHEGLATVMVRRPEKSMFMRETAIEFYNKGKLVKRYEVKDLIPAPTARMVHTTLGGGWMPWRGEAQFSADEKTVILPLLDGTTCTFDVGTGTLLKRGTSASAPR